MAIRGVNYYLDYRTSETDLKEVPLTFRVSYCLIYGTSETHAPRKAERIGVSYCLIYGTSETNGEVRTILQVVN